MLGFPLFCSIFLLGRFKPLQRQVVQLYTEALMKYKKRLNIILHLFDTGNLNDKKNVSETFQA